MAQPPDLAGLDGRNADLRGIEDNALQAIALDSVNAMALCRIAHCRALHHRDFDGAITLMERGLDCGPNYPKGWELSSYILSWTGDGTTAIRRAERAIQLSPSEPTLFQTHTALALAHYTIDDFEGAIGWVQRTYATLPRPGSFLSYGAASAAALGRTDEAGISRHSCLQGIGR